jgi:hypothetical protein
MSKTLYIIRGLPGSGKSTLGEQLADSYMDYSKSVGGIKFYSYAADDWFTDREGNYNFVPAELPDAHEDCRSRVLGAMLSGVENIAVCNTFTQAWEAAPYFKLCDMNGYTPVVLECQNQFDNIHGCPQEKINEMADRWDSREDFMYQLKVAH